MKLGKEIIKLVGRVWFVVLDVISATQDLDPELFRLREVCKNFPREQNTSGYIVLPYEIWLCETIPAYELISFF